MYEYWISIDQAKLYTKYSNAFWKNLIKREIIPIRPALPIERIKEINDSFFQVIKIPLNVLPKYAQESFLINNLIKNQFFNMDFIGYKSIAVKSDYKKLLNEIELIKKINRIRLQHRDHSFDMVKETLRRENIPLSTYYNKEQKYMSTPIKLLIDRPKYYRSTRLCPLSEQYILYYYCLPNHPKQNEILRMLSSTAIAQGKDICKKCPYNNNSTNRKKVLKIDDNCEICQKAGNGMIYPNSRHPINRFVQSIPSENIVYGRLGPNVWESFFASKTIRDKEIEVNQIWFGDHNLADVMVIAKERKDKPPILARPWITMFTDEASNAIVGAVVSLRANKKTIAECFARAVAFTVDSPFYGLPKTIVVDNGKDYRSKMLEGIDPDDNPPDDDKAILNKDFCDNDILKMLNVKVMHAKPRSGRSKVIENTFGIVTSHWFRNIPGWCGSSTQDKPFDFEKEKKRLLQKGELWTLEKFSQYFLEKIIPSYNNTVFKNNGVPTISTEQYPSPQDKYLSLPKARNLTPSWSVLAVLKEPKPSYAVRDDGIHYRNEVFWHPNLQMLKTMRKEEKKKVQIYDFDQTFCHSITVVYRGKFICEAEPLVHHKTSEVNSLSLLQHLEEQRKEKRNVSHRVTMAKQVLKISAVNSNRYVDYTPTSYYEESPIYCERIDEKRDLAESYTPDENVAEIGKFITTREKTIETIINGPNEQPLNQFYRKFGTNHEE